MREVEEFHISMVRLKVDMISISDLSALIAVNGMNSKTRNDFITQESALELTLSNMNDSSEDDEDIDSQRSHKRGKKSLFNRVKAYARNDASMQIVASKFKGQVIHEKEHEINNVSSAADNRKVYGVTESNSICRNFSRYGNCIYGDRCRYTHEEKMSTPKKMGICFEFSKNGKCSREACRYSHEEGKQKDNASDKKEPERSEIPKSAVKNPAENKVTKKVFFENIDESERFDVRMVRVEEEDDLTHPPPLLFSSDP
jgi:hypothetical protein